LKFTSKLGHITNHLFIKHEVRIAGYLVGLLFVCVFDDNASFEHENKCRSLESVLACLTCGVTSIVLSFISHSQIVNLNS
jgi:hypothetical protein